MSHLNFWILAFSTNFWPIKSDLSGNTVWPQASVFKNSPNWIIFGIFNQLLSPQNVNVARFARNFGLRHFLAFLMIFKKNCHPTHLWFLDNSGSVKYDSLSVISCYAQRKSHLSWKMFVWDLWFRLDSRGQKKELTHQNRTGYPNKFWLKY